MDLNLVLGVLGRYKRIVIGGTVLAVVLAVLSYGTPGLKDGKPTITPRGSEVWQGEAELLISQEGFPYGRAVQQFTPGKGTSVPAAPIGDETYMASLSAIYAAVANGNYVQTQVKKQARVPGTVVAAEVDDNNVGIPEPLLTLTSSAPTAADAAKLADTAASLFQSQITQQEASSGTPVNQRIELQMVKSGAPAKLIAGHKMSIPILVLFAVISASIALAFVLNNHSEEPVRATRRPLDEGVNPDVGLAFADAGNGRIAEPEHGWVQPGGGRRQRLGLRSAGSATPLAAGKNVAPQPGNADESSVSERRRARSDGEQPHYVRSSRFEPGSRD